MGRGRRAAAEKRARTRPDPDAVRRIQRPKLMERWVGALRGESSSPPQLDIMDLMNNPPSSYPSTYLRAPPAPLVRSAILRTSGSPKLHILRRGVFLALELIDVRCPSKLDSFLKDRHAAPFFGDEAWNMRDIAHKVRGMYDVDMLHSSGKMGGTAERIYNRVNKITNPPPPVPAPNPYPPYPHAQYPPVYSKEDELMVRTMELVRQWESEGYEISSRTPVTELLRKVSEIVSEGKEIHDPEVQQKVLEYIPVASKFGPGNFSNVKQMVEWETARILNEEQLAKERDKLEEKKELAKRLGGVVDADYIEQLGQLSFEQYRGQAVGLALDWVELYCLGAHDDKGFLSLMPLQMKERWYLGR
ncbi:hypothetical protein CYMTET_16255 [Cymbomonas tetramitiformis]|uniref:Uncharacterized protein n=1 Tax=Cymbomonas tetramitiformis TaxID=36881 RepID=A0AAE0GCG9_9CHLO|nr:hypothetical protein CYMTET_16255 [Cymbomonas tetramitiformis]